MALPVQVATLPHRPANETREAAFASWRFVRPRLERLEGRTAPAVVTPFTPVFSANVSGDIAIIGNTSPTRATSASPATAWH